MPTTSNDAVADMSDGSDASSIISVEDEEAEEESVINDDVTTESTKRYVLSLLWRQSCQVGEISD